MLKLWFHICHLGGTVKLHIQRTEADLGDTKLTHGMHLTSSLNRSACTPYGY